MRRERREGYVWNVGSGAEAGVGGGGDDVATLRGGAWADVSRRKMSLRVLSCAVFEVDVMGKGELVSGW